ncbi:hypothetical protein SPONN_2259 [uncultured Candidatus Thioglobus sp.]|nr:hypothetical protein SPONN_2259 [uncultured Candidatus Thioglobus sp.]
MKNKKTLLITLLLSFSTLVSFNTHANDFLDLLNTLSGAADSYNKNASYRSKCSQCDDYTVQQFGNSYCNSCIASLRAADEAIKSVEESRKRGYAFCYASTSSKGYVSGSIDLDDYEDGYYLENLENKFLSFLQSNSHYSNIPNYAYCESFSSGYYDKLTKARKKKVRDFENEYGKGNVKGYVLFDG